jgi:hypothetical protein
VSFSYFNPKTKIGTNEHWAIKVSIDTWRKIEPSSKLLAIWNEFKDWSMSFFATDRVHISERINSHRWATSVLQFYTDDPLKHQLSKLTKPEDITLFKLLADKKEQYGNVFNNPVTDICFNEIISRNQIIFCDISTMNTTCATSESKHPLSSLINASLKSQRTEIKIEKRKLRIKLSKNSGTNIQALCQHQVFDTFSSINKTSQDHHCLVCDKKWTEEVD